MQRAKLMKKGEGESKRFYKVSMEKEIYGS